MAESIELSIPKVLVDDTDFDVNEQREPLRLARVGTLLHMVGRTAAQPTIDRMSRMEELRLLSFQLYD